MNLKEFLAPTLAKFAVAIILVLLFSPVVKWCNCPCNKPNLQDCPVCTYRGELSLGEITLEFLSGINSKNCTLEFLPLHSIAVALAAYFAACLSSLAYGKFAKGKK